FDWSPFVGKNPELGSGATYWATVKAAGVRPGNPADDVPFGAEDTLNPQQRQFYNLFIGHYEQVLANLNPGPLLVNVDGAGGS
ncbi:hypothetical protein F4804DRAFT_327446, partial [Jackrogersella minutella]